MDKTLINLLKKRHQINHLEIYNIINNKFSEEIKNLEYIKDNNKIDKGRFIKYIKLDLTKITSGLVIDIKYTDKNNIKYILLLNKLTGKIWKIKPQKYYIFMHNSKKSKIRKWIDDILQNNIDEYGNLVLKKI